MAKAFVFSLCLLLVFNGCLAARQSQLSPQNQCQLNQLQAREPDNRIQAEAGQIETWNFNQDDFQCAGVAASRITIQRNGLHLPSYSNAPQLIYVVQGRGVLGAVFSGCPETFEESQQSSQEQQQQQQGEQGRQHGQQEQQQEQQGRQQEQQQGEQGRQQQQQFEQLDRHQKTRRIREGDVIAIPAGVAYWSYNDGDQELVAVNLFHVSSDHNQLDQNPRKFYLAGNPENEFNQQGQSQPRQQGVPGQQEQQQPFRRPGQQEQQGNGNNVFSGFNTQLLAQALNVNEETARNLQGQNDNRNQIIRVRGNLDFVQPPRGQQEREHEERQQEQLQQERQRAGQQGGQLMVNGLEETFCSLRLKENIGNPERADIFSPRAGRISTLNSHNLPILRWLRLSVERGFFYRNGIYSPHWNANAHSVVYVIRGNARVQVVNENGDPILDQEVQQGQLFIVPQNHGVIQQAGNQGFEYIAFKTEDNAFINTMAGRTSFLRALPDEVLANAYQISREQARQLKYNRQETIALSSSQQRGSFFARRPIV
ncbi:hypothetical protein CerSpe_292340 [Prunus speciosa]